MPDHLVVVVLQLRLVSQVDLPMDNSVCLPSVSDFLQVAVVTHGLQKDHVLVYRLCVYVVLFVVVVLNVA